MATRTHDIASVCKILGHDRVIECWVLRPVLDSDGKPAIEKVARIAWVYPRDGAGTLRVAVTDWALGGGRDLPLQYIGKAGGYGYDKRTAALAGAIVGGVELGDHCNSEGHPQLSTLARQYGWTVIGDCGH